MIQSLTASFSASFSDSACNSELELAQDLSEALAIKFPGTWSIQLHSLNHRFFDLQCQLPHFVTALKIPLHRELQRMLQRGRIECLLYYQEIDNLVPAGSFSPDLLKLLLNQLRDIEFQAESLGLHLQRPSSLELLQHCKELQILGLESDSFPAGQSAANFLSEDDKSQRQAQEALLKFCLLACEKLIVARQREGQDLYDELLGLHRIFTAQCQEAEQWEVKIPEFYRRQLTEKYLKFTELLGSQEKGELSQERLLSELSLFLVRGDVREELSRLRIHAQHFSDILHHGSGSCAKEIDFLLQEMNREVNTLGSKSPMAELQQLAVSLKVTIEQMKEQIKNVF